MKRKSFPLNLKLDLKDTKKLNEEQSSDENSRRNTPPTLAVKTITSFLTKNTSLVIKAKKPKKDIDPLNKKYSQGQQLSCLHAPPVEAYHVRQPSQNSQQPVI